LKKLLPVYDRLEQLYRLIGAFGYMREKGVTLSLENQELASSRASELEALGAPPESQLLCFPR
jgi:hypothetical protein